MLLSKACKNGVGKTASGRLKLNKNNNKTNNKKIKKAMTLGFNLWGNESTIMTNKHGQANYVD